MIEIHVNTKYQQLLIRGHDPDQRICGAITMLMRAASMLAVHAHFGIGLSVVELHEDMQQDFDALLYGVERLAERGEGFTITHHDKELHGPSIQTI